MLIRNAHYPNYLLDKLLLALGLTDDAGIAESSSTHQITLRRSLSKVLNGKLIPQASLEELSKLANTQRITRNNLVDSLRPRSD